MCNLFAKNLLSIIYITPLHRLIVLEEESKRLRNELSEEKARHKFDVDRVNKDKEEELEEVHKRYERSLTTLVKN